MITNTIPQSEAATAIGFHASFGSIVAMLSSTLAGLIWTVSNPSAMFLFSAVGVFATIIYLLFRKERIKAGN